MIKQYQIDATKSCSVTLIAAALKEYGIDHVEAYSSGRVVFKAKTRAQANAAAKFAVFVCKDKGLVAKPLK